MKRVILYSIFTLTFICLPQKGFTESDDKTLHAFGADRKTCQDHLNSGIAHAIKGDFRQAVSDFTKTLEMDPKNGSGYYFRALIWSRKGEYERAVTDFNRALEIDPKNEAAYTERAIILAKTGDDEHAFADFKKALALNPLNVAAYNGRGVLLAKTGKYDLAMQISTKPSI